MKRTRFLLLGAALLAVSGTASAFDLSNCGGGLACPWVTYGDGNSYSLALDAYMWNYYNGGGTGPSNPFYVQSGPGQISSLIVNATGAGGPGSPVVNNFPGMDNAYPTPNDQAGVTFFSMNKSAYGINSLTGSTSGSGWYPADPGGPGQFTGDMANSWDTTTAALMGFLGSGNAPVFYFNNNQTNSGSQIDQDVAVWAQITLTNSSTGASKVFDFTNNKGAYGEPGGGVFNGNPGAYTSTGAGPLAGTNASTDYVLSGGLICVTPPNPPGQPYPGFIPGNPDGTCPAGSTAINNNLGANQAAYAVVFPELNAALLTGLYDSMHVDLRYGCDPTTTDPGTNCIGRSANNGFEQLFIGAIAGSRTVPEPATLGLLGLGLLGLGLSRRKAHPSA